MEQSAVEQPRKRSCGSRKMGVTVGLTRVTMQRGGWCTAHTTAGCKECRKAALRQAAQHLRDTQEAEASSLSQWLTAALALQEGHYVQYTQHDWQYNTLHAVQAYLHVLADACVDDAGLDGGACTVRGGVSSECVCVGGMTRVRAGRQAGRH